MDGSRGRSVNLVAEARGRVQFLQKEQEGAVVPLLAASIVKLLEDVTYRLDDRQLRHLPLRGRQVCEAGVRILARVHQCGIELFAIQAAHDVTAIRLVRE